ncbi:hypothetical protein DPMN_123193 [Dreissena polymorpha]|uniref:Uncharacterized protein n=1 Tax=Dreissena polymorpha TaxID=45954 RepID=A0A9D4GTY3_DREPO|nr:hypothetical protein DPMN_123193 [Dreissena polymorpha]
MKCRCIDHDCTNIIEAVAAIERYESIIGTSTTTIRACNVDTTVDSALKQIDIETSSPVTLTVGTKEVLWVRFYGTLLEIMPTKYKPHKTT